MYQHLSLSWKTVDDFFILYSCICHMFVRKYALLLWWKTKLYYKKKEKKKKEVSKKRSLRPPHLAVCWKPPSTLREKLIASLPACFIPLGKEAPPPFHPSHCAHRRQPGAWSRLSVNITLRSNSGPGLGNWGGNTGLTQTLPEHRGEIIMEFWECPSSKLQLLPLYLRPQRVEEFLN